MSVWVPPSEANRLAEGRREYSADLLRHIDLQGTLDYWNRELHKIDPYLQLVKAKDGAKIPGLRPGFFHVIRHNPGAPPSVMPIEGATGEFREPDSGIFDELRRRDMWSGHPQTEQKKFERALKKAEELDAEERRTELHERIEAAGRTSIFVKGLGQDA